MECQHANILSIGHFARNFPSFPALYLYHIIRLRDKNGLGEVVLKIHGRWFIDVDKFFHWVENQRLTLQLESQRHIAPPSDAVLEA